MSNRELPKNSHKTGKAPSRPRRQQPQGERPQQGKVPSMLQPSEPTQQQVDSQISAMQQQIQDFLAQQSSYQQAQIQHLSPRTQAMLLEEAENANLLRLSCQPLENGMASHLRSLVGMPQIAGQAHPLAGLIPHEQLIRATQQSLRQGAGSQSLGQKKPQLGNCLTGQVNSGVADDPPANPAQGAAASQRRGLTGLASTGEGMNGAPSAPPATAVEGNVQPTENGGQEAVSPTESQQQEPRADLLQQLAHVNQVQQVLAEQCRILPLLMQQYPMAQSAPEELLAFYRQQQRSECEHASNQLRLFARRLFSKINQKELRHLSGLADDYLEQCMREHRRAENGDGPGNHGPAANALESILAQDSECGGERFLEEINKCLQPKRHSELRADFSRFMQSVFEDRAQEQAIVDFMKQMPQVYFQVLSLHQQYHWRLQIGDKRAAQELGREIADLILPYAQQDNAHLKCCVPEEVLDWYEIQYAEDGAGEQRIVSWRYVGGDSAYSGDENGSDDEDADEDGEEEMSEDEELESGEAEEEDMDDDATRDHAGDLSLVRGTISSQNDSEEAEESVEQEIRSGDSDEMSQLAATPNPRRRPDAMLEQVAVPKRGSVEPGSSQSVQLQKRYYLSQLSQQCPRNSNEVRVFECLWKSLRDVKEIRQFTKLLHIYFSGVLNLSEFEMLLYDSKFASRLRQEVINDIKKLLPTRDASRRMQSTLIKPWNDLEKQDFEKISPDSSYYRIDEEDGSFPIPTCTAKMLNPVYRDNLNDRYLSLATGSEKTETNQQHNIKNSFAEKLYQNEDRLYVRDSHIDNVKKSYFRICKILERYRASPPEVQANFKFPLHELNPLRQYWEHRLARHTDQFLKEGKVIREKELLALKKTVASHLDYLKNQKQLCLNEVKEQFRKNFTKSLDHKSLQYNKDFSNKFNFKRPVHLQRMRQLAEASQLRGQITKNQLLMLYGAADVPPESPCRFYNTFGREFARALSEEKLHLPRDHPIDMQFLEVMPLASLSAIQQKCPQARFHFSDRRIVSLAVMLCIFGLQNSSQQGGGPAQQNEQTQALQFMLEFVGVSNYDAIAAQCEQLSLLDQEMIDMLTNSAEFYRKRYNGELRLMQDLYVIDDGRTRRESAANQLQDEVFADKEMARSSKQKEAGKEPLKSCEETNYNNHQLNITVGHPNLLEKVNKLSQNDDKQAPKAARNPENENEALKESALNAQASLLAETQRLHVENLSQEDDRLKIEQDVHDFDELSEAQKTDTVARLEEEMKRAIFVPAYRYGRHKLLYGSANMYCFMHYFYALCERLEKGYRLVEAKVKQDFKDDFSHMSLQDKLADIQTEIVHERFQYLVKGIITMMCQPSVLSGNEYDDLGRQMLGNDAYLLFQMDKLVSVVLKQLHHFQTDNGCKSARQLYEKIENEELQVRDESCYLTSFFELASKQAEPQPGQSTLTGAAAANKDNANPPLITMAYRLLYSDTSNILSVHYVSFNPFTSGAADTKSRPGQGPQPTSYVGPCTGWQGSDLDYYLHSLDRLLHERVENRKLPFMARSKRKMEHATRGAPKLCKNGLIVHKVPLTGNLWYEEGTEDVLLFDDNGLPKVGQKRRRSAVIRQDVQKRRRYLDVLEQRRKQVLQHAQSQDDEEMNQSSNSADN